MSERFFVAAPIVAGTASLSGAEARHAAQVMRAKVGDQLVLFDGSGAEFVARVVQLKREEIACEVLSRREVDREAPLELTLGVALPKGDRQRWLIEKAVELGLRKIVPLETQRGVAQPLDRVLERLRRAVVEASKQCGRNRLMDVAAPQSVAQFLAAAPRDALRLIADPAPSASPLASVDVSGASREVFLVVGPEGGLTDRELQAAEGWRSIGLGPRILRVETAAIALAAWFSLQPPESADRGQASGPAH